MLVYSLVLLFYVRHGCNKEKPISEAKLVGRNIHILKMTTTTCITERMIIVKN